MNAQQQLVPVSKVAYGTFSFMWVRLLINNLIKERNRLRPAYVGNELRYGWISNTIRALADLVYFERPYRKATQHSGPAPEYPNSPKRKKIDLKKNRKSLKQQPTLF